MAKTEPDYDEIDDLAAQVGLKIFGGFHPTPDDNAPPQTQTLIMFGPDEPRFWSIFTNSPEYADGSPDPLDRWSRRVVGGLADTIGGDALFPFGGPPYVPFIAWAARTGRAWASPVTLLVHNTAGLFVSYRGAIALHRRLDLGALPVQPCNTCADQPCRTACPVQALTQDGYDVAACHAFLDTKDGADCMNRGCKVRRSCPVSQRLGRAEAQSAFHMKAFHP